MSHYSRHRTELIEPTAVEVSWLGISAKWVADREQQAAAWETYVELVTRIALQPLADDHGLLREALSSAYSLFGKTRRILRQRGTGAARQLSNDTITSAHIAVVVLHNVLRRSSRSGIPRCRSTNEAIRRSQRERRHPRRGGRHRPAARDGHKS